MMTAAAVAVLCAACGSDVKITKPSVDAQIIIDRGRNVETEAELRDLERLANEYEIAYRQRINGAAAERFKELTADVLTDAARNMQEYQQRQEDDQALRRTIDDKLDVLDKAWSLSLTTPEQDRQKLEQTARRVEDLDRELAEIASERRRVTEALDAIGYDDENADELLERYGNELDALDRRQADVEAALNEALGEVALYRLAYKLQRGEEFAFATASDNSDAESCDEECDCM